MLAIRPSALRFQHRHVARLPFRIVQGQTSSFSSSSDEDKNVHLKSAPRIRRKRRLKPSEKWMEPDFRAEAREKWRINELRRIGRGEATVSRSSLTDTGGSWLDRRLEKEDKEEQPKVAIKNGKTEDVSDEDRSILPTEKAPSRPRWIDRMLPENYQSDANYLSDRIEEEVAKVSHEDGLPSSPLLRRLPASLLPYAALARLDKPIGTYLLLHPCLWSAALAGSPALVAAAPPFLSSAA
eukprot:CAMPEP_0113314606 /NCGR_PEP_ID=MMETSP0010_2-20120614/10595_1 /TAXON_ID=216773 ORGANISM="Corethron hystrix, Strain 308" /NCGR_SAMPLE_ID=MMETSP0010_2 /ASSEMBLY_ACC=CAM_ASM_000155 /LENGTH=238 /DNA_ID=CAMNT_0000170917 /DNA_START=107 /DNA_END=819 /DNA_ORIENTATION=- /assembly_acc=CAM_ASM_000155